ncbi:MAG: ComZ family protein [Bacillus sp. (in: firmicutes)]
MNKQNEFLKIAMKHFPEAKVRLKEAGIDVSLNMLPAFMDLFTKVMGDAYELGIKEGRRR